MRLVCHHRANRNVLTSAPKYRVAQKSKPLPSDQKIVLNRIKVIKD